MVSRFLIQIVRDQRPFVGYRKTSNYRSALAGRNLLLDNLLVPRLPRLSPLDLRCCRRLHRHSPSRPCGGRGLSNRSRCGWNQNRGRWNNGKRADGGRGHRCGSRSRGLNGRGGGRSRSGRAPSSDGRGVEVEGLRVVGRVGSSRNNSHGLAAVENSWVAKVLDART